MVELRVVEVIVGETAGISVGETSLSRIVGSMENGTKV